MPSYRAPLNYTLVQHSAAGYKNDPRFSRGLQPAAIHDSEERERVLTAGGLLFSTYVAADRFGHACMYHPNCKSFLIPDAQGKFHLESVDGLRIYIPTDEEQARAFTESEIPAKGK